MASFYIPQTSNGIKVIFPQIFAELMMGNGCWPIVDDINDNWLILKKILYWIFGCIWFAIDIFITFCELAYLTNNIMDIVKAVESFCTSMIAVFIIIRTFHIRFVMDELKKLLKLFGEKIWISRDAHPRIVENNDRVMRPVFLIFVLMFNVLLIYNVVPIVHFFKANQTLKSQDKRLPYSMIFPYNEQDDWKYVASYVGAFITGYFTISHFYAFDAMLFMFVTHLCGQFQILHANILRLIPECHAEWLRRFAGAAAGKDRKVVPIGDKGKCITDNARPDNVKFRILQDMYTKRLHALAARHNELISFCEKLNNLISLPLLVNIINSTFLICFCGFEFILSMETSYYLYFCNWEGGKISKDSPLLLKPEDMDLHLLSAKLPLWKHIEYYPANKDFILKILFMIKRSQRPIQLSAMKFTTLSLESFTNILKASMSYFALLNTLLNKQK